MTKKFLSLFAVLSIAAMAILSSCTSAGVECGLIGKWEYSESGLKITAEFTSDDLFKVTTEATVFSVTTTNTTESNVKSVKDHTVTTEKSGVEADVEYKDLGCDSVKFKFVGEDWRTYKKVF